MQDDTDPAATAEWLTVPATGGIWFVRRGTVDANSLVHAKPGTIIFFEGDDPIRYIPPQLTFEHYGFIAGMVSDAA